MATVVDKKTSLNINVSQKERAISVPINEFNALESVKPYRLEPFSRNPLSLELESGNFKQEYRFPVEDIQYLSPGDMASGVISKDDCQVIEFLYENKEVESITPVLKNGRYSIDDNDYFLYGSKCTSEILDSTVYRVKNPINLSIPVTLAIWTRDKKGSIVPHRKFNAVTSEEFLTKKLTESGRSDSEVSGKIDEYWFEKDVLKLNSGGAEVFWKEDVESSQELLFHSDHIGNGNGESCQYFYSKYFPISPEDPRKVYTLETIDETEDGIQEWDIVENFLSSGEGDYHCVIDYDLGIIKFGGTLGGESTLLKESTGADSFIEVSEESEFPYSGTIVIEGSLGSEEIRYTGKIGNKLLGLERDLGLPAEAGSRVRVKETGQRPSAGSHVIAMYTSRPRLDYRKLEGKEEARRDLSISPYEMRNNESLICIDRRNQKLSNVILNVLDVSLIKTSSGESCFGPVFYQEDVVTIEGLITDENQNPIPNIEVTVKVTDGNGYLDYLKEVNLVSDDSGKFWVTYIPQGEDLFKPAFARLSDVSYDGDQTIVDFSFPSNVKIESSDLSLLHIYSVMKDDPLTGTVGSYHEVPLDKWTGHVDIGSYIGSPLSAVYSSVVERAGGVEGILLVGPGFISDLSEYEGGRVKIGHTPLPYNGSTQAISYIEVPLNKIINGSSVWLLDVPDNSIRKNTFIAVLDELLDIELNSITDIWIKRKEDKDWDSSLLNGRMNALRVLAKSSDSDSVDYTPWSGGDAYDDTHTTGSWLHPNSPDSTKVYKPVTPVSHEGGSRFRFNGKLPLPGESNDRNILGAYAIFGDVKSKIQAFAKDPACFNRLVESNEVCLVNSRGSKDTGTYLASNGYVPYGWRLASSSFEVASSISSATYLTFNNIKRVASLSGKSSEYIGPVASLIEGEAIIYNTEETYNSMPGNITFEIIVTE